MDTQKNSQQNDPLRHLVTPYREDPKEVEVDPDA